MSPHDKQAQKQGREAKRAAALRENLARRKQQKQERQRPDSYNKGETHGTD